MRSREISHCPYCDGDLEVIGSRKRKIYREDGSTATLIIRRLRCRTCRRIHHELPDCIVPYKRYNSAAIEAALTSDGSTGCFPGENSTVYRLKRWFAGLRAYFETVLRSLPYLYQRDRILAEETGKLLPLAPLRLSSGWLADLVRKVANSGRWRTDPFCNDCP